MPHSAAPNLNPLDDSPSAAAAPPTSTPAVPPADRDLERFAHATYTIRKKVFKLFGGAFHIYDSDGEVVLYSKMKAFKLREDLRLYASQAMQQELLTISARQILDFGATYDVRDPVSEETVGSLRRSGFKSFFLRDEWVILDEHDQQIARISESSAFKALLRRWVDFAAFLLPQSYEVRMGERVVATMRQNFNPFVQKIEVNFHADPDMQLDRRLGLAAGVLLAAIEGRQQ